MNDNDVRSISIEEEHKKLTNIKKQRRKGEDFTSNIKTKRRKIQCKRGTIENGGLLNTGDHQGNNNNHSRQQVQKNVEATLSKHNRRKQDLSSIGLATKKPKTSSRPSTDRMNPRLQQYQLYHGKTKWTYNSEHKEQLFGDLKFVAERQDLAFEGDMYLWRILKKGIAGRPCIRKFVPIVIDGRECHTGVDTFIPIRFNEAFFNKYQPVIFRMLVDNEKLQIGIHYRIDRSLPLLGYFPASQYLFPDFKQFLIEITKMALKGEYKEEVILGPSDDTTLPGNSIEDYFKKNIDAIMADNKWPSDTLACILAYPKFTMSKQGVQKTDGCTACSSINKKAIGAYKLICSGPIYDPCTLKLQDFEKDKGPVPKLPDYQFCHSCPITLRTLHKMIHYKWWLYVSIRAQVIDLCKKLKPDEQFRAGDILKHFVGDFEWVEKMFLDFQTIACEGTQEVKKAEKREIFQKKRNGLCDVKKSTKREKKQSRQEFSGLSKRPQRIESEDGPRSPENLPNDDIKADLVSKAGLKKSRKQQSSLRTKRQPKLKLTSHERKAKAGTSNPSLKMENSAVHEMELEAETEKTLDNTIDKMELLTDTPPHQEIVNDD